MRGSTSGSIPSDIVRTHLHQRGAGFRAALTRMRFPSACELAKASIELESRIWTTDSNSLRFPMTCRPGAASIPISMPRSCRWRDTQHQQLPGMALWRWWSWPAGPPVSCSRRSSTRRIFWAPWIMDTAACRTDCEGLAMISPSMSRRVFGVEQDAGQRIVELMGQAGAEYADGHQLVRRASAASRGSPVASIQRKGPGSLRPRRFLPGWGRWSGWRCISFRPAPSSTGRPTPRAAMVFHISCTRFWE